MNVKEKHAMIYYKTFAPHQCTYCTAFVTRHMNFESQ